MPRCTNLIAVAIIALSASTWANPVDRRQKWGDDLSPSSICPAVVTLYITVTPTVMATASSLPEIILPSSSIFSSTELDSVSSTTIESWSEPTTIASSTLSGTIAPTGTHTGHHEHTGNTGPNGGSSFFSGTSAESTLASLPASESSLPPWTTVKSWTTTTAPASSLPTWATIESSGVSTATTEETIVPTSGSSASMTRKHHDHISTAGLIGASGSTMLTNTASRGTTDSSISSWTATESPTTTTKKHPNYSVIVITGSSGAWTSTVTISISEPTSFSEPRTPASSASTLFLESSTETELTNAATSTPCPESEMTLQTTTTTINPAATSTLYPESTITTPFPESSTEAASTSTTPCPESEMTSAAAPTSPQTPSIPPYPTNSACPAPSVVYSTITATTTVMETITSYAGSWVTSTIIPGAVSTTSIQ